MIAVNFHRLYRRGRMKFHLTNICIVLISLTVAGNLTKISALSCYHCIPQFDDNEICNDPYSMLEENLLECPRNQSHVCGKALLYRNDTVMTMRTCIGNTIRTEDWDFRLFRGFTKMECFYCDEDGCNAAHHVTISPTSQYLIVVSIIISLAWYGIFDF